jgi:hypothetical protein
MISLEWASLRHEFGFYLQRQLWRPLRNMMEIFHVLPLVAVLILFIFLATDGQFREIYIAYLEGARNHSHAWMASVALAFLTLALISAVLYEAHTALSAMRIKVVYSSYSDPAAGSKLRSMQRAAAFVLAFLPWLGLAVGLFGARNFVADRFCHLLIYAGVKGDALQSMQYLPVYGGYRIAVAVILLGLAVVYFVSIGEQHRMAQRVVACFALPAAALLFLLFTDWFNISADTSTWILTCVAIFVGGVLYFLIYRWLYRMRMGGIFSRLSFGVGISLRKRRRHWLAVWAFLPWFFLAIYFIGAQYAAGPLQPVNDWPLCPVASYPEPGRWAIFPTAMCFTIALGLIVGHTLGWLSEYKWRRLFICALVLVLAFCLGILSVSSDYAREVFVYRLIGPLGTVLLELLFLISTFALLAVLSQRSGFPALTLALLTMIVSAMFPNYAGITAIALAAVYFVFAIAGFLSGQRAVGFVGLVLPFIVWINWHPLHSEPTVDQNSSTAVPAFAVNARFQCWLAFRGVIPVAPGQPAPDCSTYGTPPPARAFKYPVFIIAAEGGGIYAASAASMLLATLQDTVPEFSKHVFAISGVSGGSIGAAIFRAVDHAVPIPGSKATKMEDEVARVMQADHFSPVVGSIFPEIFGAPLTRANALVASFEYSASAQDAEAGNELRQAFANSWLPSGDAPALVLNSTWVETGFRVAFAPFELHGTDESLYSFQDPDMPSVDTTTNLMEAAAVSARFPLIMPPFSVVMKNADKAQQGGRERWNFVDGAYSDNSGASTAIDIYRAIKDTPNIDLHIILITSTNTAPNLRNGSINGTVFHDTVAPFDALMKVRSDLGDDAVARACTYIYPVRNQNRRSVSSMEANDFCVNQSWDKDGKPLQIVEIQDQTYGLALGWKISSSTFAVVKWMLGRPDGCVDRPTPSPDPGDTSAAETPVATADNPNAQLTQDILRRNSCVLTTMAKLVGDSEAAIRSSKAAK